MEKFVAICVVGLALLNPVMLTQGQTWNTLPQEEPYEGVVRAYGVDNGIIVGSYGLGHGGDSRGFIYDGENYQTVHYPGSRNTFVYGIDGSNVVGGFTLFSDESPAPRHGFRYDYVNNVWVDLNIPCHYYGSVRARDIDGGYIVGSYVPPTTGGYHGFVTDLNGTVFVHLDYPIACIDGNWLIAYNGMVYNGTSWTDDYLRWLPGQPVAMDGNNMVGNYVDDSGNHKIYIFNKETWDVTTLTPPWPAWATDIEGNTIVGITPDENNPLGEYGFVCVLDLVASFKYDPEEPMVGGRIEFDASESEGNIAEYEWDFGDGQSAICTTPEVVHTYTKTGIYNVKLTVTYKNDLEASKSVVLDLTLESGDILLCRSPWAIVPGKEWTHAGIYVKGIEDMVVEALPWRGVITRSLSEWNFDNMTYVRALRVKDPVIRDRAIQFASRQLGKPYSLAKIFLQLHGLLDKSLVSNSWYCSELVWAAYYYASVDSIDLDYGYYWNAVAPDELDGHPEAKLHREHKEVKPTTTWNLLTLVGGITFCPVDLNIVDPDGLILNKQGSQIPETIYEESDVDGDNDPDDFFAILQPKEGIYLIQVSPEAGALPTDTYTFVVFFKDQKQILAENVLIEDIPSDPYVIKVTETDIIPMVPATVDFDPDTLNPFSASSWITAYVELPSGHGYNAEAINITSLMLNGQVTAETHPTEIGDYDEDGIPDLMAKFSKQEVVEILEPGLQIVQLTGQLSDGTLFVGDDTIRVLDKNKDIKAEAANDSVETSGEYPLDAEEAIGFMLFEASEIINELGPESFNSEESAFELACAINDVFTMLDEGMHFEVIVMLEDDILQRMDGCANTGQPDEDDWITSIEGQALLYPRIAETIELLESML